MSIKEFTKLNLGDKRPRWDGFISAGLGAKTSSVHVKLNITEKPPEWMLNKYEFIYSERMLEHINHNKIVKVVRNIDKMLVVGGTCRMVLPFAFYGPSKTNMLRKNNMENCKYHGHVTWFINEGYGDVKPSLMGRTTPPEKFTLWKDTLQNTSLRYEPVVYYDSTGEMFIDTTKYDPENPSVFVDCINVSMNRYPSLIFDLVKEQGA